MAGLAESVSHFCVWIMGIVAGIYFVETFEAELKPLVLAFLFVSMLEAVVQVLEFLFLKIWVFLKLLVYTAYLVAKCCKRKVVGWCRRCKCDASIQDLKRQLCNCDELLEKWSETAAGKNIILRVVSVVLTLMLVVGVLLVLQGLFASEGKQFVDKMPLYRKQLESMSAWCNDHVGSVEDRVPVQYQNISKAVVRHVQEGFDNLVKDLPDKAEEWGVEVIHTVVASSSAFVIGLLFFFLYSAIMLFDPLHINLEKEEKRDNNADLSRTQVIRQRLGADVEEGQTGGKAGDLNTVRLNELQHYVYKIVWNYFFVTLLLNIVFAACVGALLTWLKVELAVILSAVCFFLAFIPELGAIISTVLPLPFVLLSPTATCAIHAAAQDDCISDMVYRLWISLEVVGGIILIKVLVANVLYSLVMGKNKVLAGAVKDDVDEVSNTHGVIVLFAVVFFGKIWGIAGMLISVPVLSVIRLSLNVGKVRTLKRAQSLELKRVQSEKRA